MKESIRAGYQELGIDEYYKQHSGDYHNPHFCVIKNLLERVIEQVTIGNNILDLCCGSGEVTRILSGIEGVQIEGLDPYTAPAYKNKTNKNCLIHDFKDIVNGALENKKYDTIICSFAMHLCEESMLNSLLYQLSRISRQLIIITPHKRPEINQWWIETYRHKEEKVTIRVYKSTQYQ